MALCEGIVTLKKSVLQKCENFSKKGSLPYRVCKLLKNGDFFDIISSQELAHLLNEGAGKKIKVNSLTALMEPLLKEDMVKIKIVGKGRNKRKFWFPGWIDKKQTENKIHKLFDDLKLHNEVIIVSEKLFKDSYYAQAVFEALKRLDIYVKEKSNMDDSGKSLMFKVFNIQSPILKLNKLKTQTDRDEQEGYMHLFAGAMQGIRDPKGHDIINLKDPYKALDFLCLASLLFKKVDESKR